MIHSERIEIEGAAILPKRRLNLASLDRRARGETDHSTPTLCAALDDLTRISHQAFAAAADPSVSIALHSLGLLDALSTTPDGPSAARLVSMPVCAASLRNLVRKAG